MMVGSDLSLIRGWDPIFRKDATPVTQFDPALAAIVDGLFALLYAAQGVGLAAPMAGISKRIALVDLQPSGLKAPLALINPVVVKVSDEMQSFVEASLCFPGIEAEVTRSASIEIAYHSVDGTAHTRAAQGWLAQVIQHEIDYLDGTLFIDHLPRARRDLLLKKIKKIR